MTSPVQNKSVMFSDEVIEPSDQYRCFNCFQKKFINFKLMENSKRINLCSIECLAAYQAFVVSIKQIRANQINELQKNNPQS